jgi:hypothetical protein
MSPPTAAAEHMNSPVGDADTRRSGPITLAKGWSHPGGERHRGRSPSPLQSVVAVQPSRPQMLRPRSAANIDHGTQEHEYRPTRSSRRSGDLWEAIDFIVRADPVAAAHVSGRA